MFDIDYFDELRSPDMIKSGDLFAEDYDLDIGDVSSVVAEPVIFGRSLHAQLPILWY